MSKKPRYFAIVAHCLLNPSTKVHILGKRYIMAEKVSHFFLSHHISIIQLPCPEFTAMGYLRNPQGRQQYDNIFFREHCKKELHNYINMICELKNNSNTPLCFIGIQGSPTCSIYWGKHKQNRYKTESIMEDPLSPSNDTLYGVMTSVLDELLKNEGIYIPYLEMPSKEALDSERSIAFFDALYDLIHVPPCYREPLIDTP